VGRPHHRGDRAGQRAAPARLPGDGAQRGRHCVRGGARLRPHRRPETPPLAGLSRRSPHPVTRDTRIRKGEKLRVSFYHSLIVYEDRVTHCLSEPRIFADWRAEVQRADSLFHPAAFFMSHDELRVVNQCALCQSKGLTPGQLLAWNVHQSAQIIREVRPDAEIWVWSDMFDPQHNAVDQYYAVNGSLRARGRGWTRG